MSNAERAAGLKVEVERLRGLNTQLSQQIAILKAEADADKARLDWMERNEAYLTIVDDDEHDAGRWCVDAVCREWFGETLREAIDNAMEAAK